MPAPPPYERQANFKNAQALSPSAQTNGAALDGEFNAIKATLDAIESRLPSIQRDDGRLANASVTIDQLSPSLSTGFTLQGPWAAGIQYNTGDGVIYGLKFYRARIANLSTTLNSPLLSSATWIFLADLAAIAGVISASADQAGDGSAAVPGIGFASQALGFFKQAAGIIGVSIAGVQKFLISAAGVELPADPVLALHAATKQYVDAAIATALGPALAAAVGGDIGVVKWFPAAAIPANHELCYGQLLSRTLPLFGVFGTTYGAGDGSTTFNNIDMRGIVPAGVDNMGGVAASRLTSIAAAIGTLGGEEKHTLLAGELAAHAHGVTDPGHIHTGSVASHSHSYSRPNATVFATSGGVPVLASPATNDVTGNTAPAVTVNNHATGITVNSTAAGVGHNNVQPTRVGNWIVRVQ